MGKASLPVDGNEKPVQLTPDRVALAVTTDDTISAATDLTLNAKTTFLEVTAIDKGIYMRYAATASSTAYDEFIAANTTRQYFVPPNVTVVSFIQEAATAKLRVIEK